MKRTGFVYDDIFLAHSLGPGHPESPDRLAAIVRRLSATGLKPKLAHISPTADRSLIETAILTVHSRVHYDTIRQWGKKAAPALTAVGAVLAAVDAVMTGEVANAFCAVRPPGHHAQNHGANCDGRYQGEGFCFFNNIAIGARYAQSAHGAERILIVDWDYHHGNGTEWAFYEDKTVFYFSTHALYDYPVTGHSRRRGRGEGKGYNLNVPLPEKAGNGAIIAAFESVLVPALRELDFRPDLIMISAGFDSRKDDPIGTFTVTDTGFAELTRIMKALASVYCHGKIVSVLEGGYNPVGLAQAVSIHLRVLGNGA